MPQASSANNVPRRSSWFTLDRDTPIKMGFYLSRFDVNLTVARILDRQNRA